MRILLIEDDDGVAHQLGVHCTAMGHIMDWTALGEDGYEPLARQPRDREDYDIAIIDAMLPDGDGVQITHRLRTAGLHLPILILTPPLATVRVAAFDAGADDALSKPIESLDEVLARCIATVRRSRIGAPSNEIQVGRLVIDMRLCEVRYRPPGTEPGGGRQVTIRLSPKEYALIQALALRRGTSLRREQLVHSLYADFEDPHLKIIDVFVCKLRRKLSGVDPELGTYISTIPSTGYALRVPDVAAA